ncbi:MAG: S9 family peptidase [Pyrinomonadaceae bacterium]
MSRKFTLSAAFVLIVICSTISLAQPAKLIDREIFFGNPEISGAQISPDGKYISFIKPFHDTRNVWVKGVDEPFEKARLLTAETKRPVAGYFWSQDGKYILFVKDNDGDENFNVYAVNPLDKPSEGQSAPTARNITEGKKVRAFIQNVPESDPDTIYVGLNERDPAWHDIYKVSISTGKKTLIMENKDRLAGLIFDNADKIRLSVRSAQNGDTEILSLDGDAPKVIYSCNVFETCAPIRFHKDNRRIYIQTNKGDRNLTQLVLLDVATGKETLVEQDPKGRVDFGNAIFSEVSKELIATTYTDAKREVYFKDKNFEKDFRWLEKNLPGKEVNLGSSTKDEMMWIVSASSDVEPGETYLFDRKNKKLTLQYKIRDNLPREVLAEMKPITYKSSDGLEIPAYLTLPKGVPAKNLPVVVNPHGGPWGRDGWGYDTLAQFFANRGYAVLQMNFRGSTGYGKKFLDAGNGQWGDLMQDDITWGVKYLVDQGIADPKRVGILGGSYGGYATLAGVTFTPDLYAGAVAIVAPSNLITLLESVPPYWESIRTMFYKRMGDPTTEAGKKQLIRQSPLTHADKIKTPLLVVQGANDPRVNKRESDQIVIALRERNYPVEYIVAPDEGHGFQRPINNLAMFASAEKFLAKHLGGRYQAEMSETVAKRLGEITVDPKDVTMPVKPDMNAAPAVEVSGTWNLNAEAGGQSVPIVLELKQNQGGFDGTVSTPYGNGTVENGKISGTNLEGTIKIEIQGQFMELALSGKIEGGKFAGTIEGPGIPVVSFSGQKGN